MRNEYFDWTDDRIKTLRALWAGGHSASQIGVLMQINKNQVLGKVHRLKLAPRAVAPKKRVPSEAVVARVVASPKRILPRRGLANVFRVERAPRKVAHAALLPPGDDAINLPDAPQDRLEGRLVFSHIPCRFPLWGDGESPTHRYCGDPVIGRDDNVASAYCKEHGKICWTGTMRKAGSPAPMGHHNTKDRGAWRISA